MAWAAEIRRSHSRARAVAMWGFDGGMRRGVLVVGFRTERVSRWIRWLDSGVVGGSLVSGAADSIREDVVGSIGVVGVEEGTIVCLYTDVFPEAFLHCCTGLHLACP